MSDYQGSCHCGAVKFRFSSEPITTGVRCTCSLCKRKGAVMSGVMLSQDELHIDAEEGTLSCYQFGTMIAKHYFCNRCGIYTFHETVRKPGFLRVNLGCIDGIDPLAVESQVFDGANLL